MIYENLVYLDGDENGDNYTQNHYVLFEAIYDKSLQWVREHMRHLVAKYKVAGYQQGY